MSSLAACLAPSLTDHSFALSQSFFRDALVPDTIFETTINGLSSAFENKTADAIANATVKVTIELNESNIVSVNKAVVIFPEEDPAASNTFNGEAQLKELAFR